MRRFAALIAFFWLMALAGCSPLPSLPTIKEDRSVSNHTAPSEQTIKVHFLDVGQADCIYLQLPGQIDILIDAGNRDDGPMVVEYLKTHGADGELDLLIATHPHEDHIGGIPSVLDSFAVKQIIDSGYNVSNKTCRDYKTSVQAEVELGGAVWTYDDYQVFYFGSTLLQVLTGREKQEDANDYSVICRLDTGEVEFLFTGDTGGRVEAGLEGNLEAEVLKVDHHGSRTSSSSRLLEKVNPEVAVISVGAEDPYNHPTTDVLQRLNSAGAAVYRTDLNGSVQVVTNGLTYEVVTEKIQQ